MKMTVIRKIISQGFFEAMVDERIDKKARGIVLFLTTICFVCVLIVLTTLGITFNIQSGRIAFWILDFVTLILLIVLHIHLHFFKIKKKKEKMREDEEKRKVKERVEAEYEDVYTHENGKFYT